MLRIYKNTQLKDYLRTCQGSRGYGLQISNDVNPLQIGFAYCITNETVTSFKLNRIDSGNEILSSITLNVNLLKYEIGQYLIDNTKIFGVTIQEGVYFYEFSNGRDTFYSEIFKIETIQKVFRWASNLLMSSQKKFSTTYE